MNKIANRQLCFLLAFLLPVGKFVSAPALLAEQAQDDLLLSALFNMLLQGLAVYLLLFLSERTDKTLYALLESASGKVAAKTGFCRLALYILFFSAVPLLEQKSYVQSEFYDTVPALLVFLPFFLFSAFACTKNLTSIGRSADIAVPLFLFSYLGLAVLSFGAADFAALLPFAKMPFRSIAKGSLYTQNWFSDAAFLLLFLGRFEGSKKTTGRAMLSYLAGCLFVLFFLALFYGIFQSVAPREKFALSRIGRFSPALATLGGVYYLFSYTMSLVLLFYAVLPLQMCCESLCFAFGDHRKWYALVVNLICLFFVAAFNHAGWEIYGIVESKLFFIFLLFAFLVPALSPLLLLAKRNRRSS